MVELWTILNSPPNIIISFNIVIWDTSYYGIMAFVRKKSKELPWLIYHYNFSWWVLLLLHWMIETSWTLPKIGSQLLYRQSPSTFHISLSLGGNCARYKYFVLPGVSQTHSKNVYDYVDFMMSWSIFYVWLICTGHNQSPATQCTDLPTMLRVSLTRC